MLVSAHMETNSQPGKFVDLGNVRKGPLYDSYLQIEKDGIDPFEYNEFIKRHPYPIDFKNNSWFATKNGHPYEGTETHLLLVHFDFITSIKEISSEGWKDLPEVINELSKIYNIEAGALMMRFGDTSQTGASVKHLHAHIIIPKKEDAKRKIIMPSIFEKQSE